MWWFFITCGGHLVHSETLATASLTTSRQSTASARKHKGKIANGVKKNKSDKVFQIFSTNLAAEKYRTEGDGLEDGEFVDWTFVGVHNFSIFEIILLLIVPPPPSNISLIFSPKAILKTAMI